jgi:hypothetical protein
METKKDAFQEAGSEMDTQTQGGRSVRASQRARVRREQGLASTAKAQQSTVQRRVGQGGVWRQRPRVMGWGGWTGDVPCE